MLPIYASIVAQHVRAIVKQIYNVECNVKKWCNATRSEMQRNDHYMCNTLKQSQFPHKNSPSSNRRPHTASPPFPKTFSLPKGKLPRSPVSNHSGHGKWTNVEFLDSYSLRFGFLSDLGFLFGVAIFYTTHTHYHIFTIGEFLYDIRFLSCMILAYFHAFVNTYIRSLFEVSFLPCFFLFRSP